MRQGQRRTCVDRTGSPVRGPTALVGQVVNRSACLGALKPGTGWSHVSKHTEGCPAELRERAVKIVADIRYEHELTWRRWNAEPACAIPRWPLGTPILGQTHALTC